VNVEVADNMKNGWKEWLEWHRTACPANVIEIQAVEADGGRYLGYIRLTGRRRDEAKPEEPIISKTKRAGLSPRP
jgi:hypothetical protein